MEGFVQSGGGCFGLGGGGGVRVNVGYLLFN